MGLTSISIKSFNKQPSEKFVIYGDFSDVLATGEEIDIANSTVTVYDAIDEVAVGIAGSPQVAGDDNERIAVVIQAGVAASSPYKITFKGQTTLGYIWEIDVLMRVLEV